MKIYILPGEERLASSSCDTQRGQASTFLEVEARFGFDCCPKASYVWPRHIVHFRVQPI